ncbi:MAG: peptidase MA family metallohydrolase [Candidatus Omnitrophica bacterium]|nr:peptidase MA family metallohydrolase [Candidatus Omnitrophota bacterium]
MAKRRLRRSVTSCAPIRIINAIIFLIFLASGWRIEFSEISSGWFEASFQTASWVVAAESDACSLVTDWERYYEAYPTDANRKQLAVANNNCGIEYADKGQWNTAERYLLKAKSLDPENPMFKRSLANVIAHRAQEAFDANEFRLAQADYEKALRYDPDNSQIKMALSEVLYRVESRTDRVRDYANDGAQDLNGGKFREKIDQYGREMMIERKTHEEKFRNWILRFQEGLPEVETAKIFDLLEDISYRIGEDLQYWIKRPVVVVLTDEASFKAIHTGPRWAGALNDGRIKVPITGVSWEDQSFKRILAHEYTHSVIEDLANRRFVPFWFEEGVAQYEELKVAGEDPGDSKHFFEVSRARRDGSLLLIRDLSTRDIAERLTPGQVQLAYQESLAFVLYLVENFRFYTLTSFLREIRSGKNLEEAVTTGIGRNLDFLEEDWKSWLGWKWNVELQTPISSS